MQPEERPPFCVIHGTSDNLSDVFKWNICTLQDKKRGGKREKKKGADMWLRFTGLNEVGLKDTRGE